MRVARVECIKDSITGNLHMSMPIRFSILTRVSSPHFMSPPIHAFSLPPELLQNITLRSRPSQNTTGIPEKEDLSSQPRAAPVTSSGARACNVCLGATFLDVEEQRTHFRSDWHRYNVKIRLRGGNAVSEVDFAKLVDSTSFSFVFGEA